MNSIDIMLNKTIKILVVTLTSIMLIICGIFVFPPSYAISSDNFEILYRSSIPSSSNYYEGYTYAKYSTVDKYSSISLNRNDQPPIYFFTFSENFSTGNGSICFCVPESEINNYYTGDLVINSKPNGTSYYRIEKNAMSLYNGYYYRTYSDYTGYHISEQYTPYFNSVESGIDALVHSLNSGTFYAFPQTSSDTYITYEYIEGNGIMVYASPNTYHLMGAYNSINAPLSQYCYISNGDNNTSFAVFSSVPLTVYSSFLNGGTYTYGVCSQYDTNKYYYIFPETIASNIDNSFESLEDAQNAFTGASGSEGAGVVTAGALTIDLPAGNVIYIRPRAGSIARLDVRYPYLSNSFGSPFPLSAYWASGISALPDSNTTMPLSGMSQITWSVDTSSVNGYGQSYNGYTTHAPFNSGWFVVYNPTYYLFNTGDSSANIVSPTITIKMQYATEYHIYDLSMSLINNTSTSNTNYETSQDGIINPDNPDQWDKTSTLPNEEPSIAGQQNEIVEAQNFSVTDYLKSIKDTINKFANDFVQLLTAPISHIRQLITYATAFMQSISQFFVWLPEPVYAVLVSALIIAVVIGVLKLLF